MDKTLEHQKLVHAILLDLGQRPLIRVWKNVTGIGKVGGRAIRFGLVGSADISGIMGPRGQRIELEIKTGNAKQSYKQKCFERMITSLGGIYAICRSVNDARRALGLELGDDEGFTTS